jgi:serine/threonine-protein kinase
VQAAQDEARAITELFGVEQYGGVQWRAEYHAREYDKCLEIAKATPFQDSHLMHWPSALMEGLTCLAMGNKSAARTRFESARDYLLAKIATTPNDPRYHGALGIAYAGLGSRPDALRHAERATELLPPAEDSWRAGPRRYELAVTMTLLGDNDAAIDQLELLLSGPAIYSVHTLRKEPTFDALRENPRFKALVAGS